MSPSPASGSVLARAFSISASYNVNLVFNVDVLLLCILAIFVLFALPRSAVRFTHLSEWSEGHLFRWVDVRVRRQRILPDTDISTIAPAHLTSKSATLVPADPFAEVYNDKWQENSDDGHSYASHVNLNRSGSSSSQAYLNRNPSTVSTISGRPRRLPTHMASWSTMVPPVANFFRKTIRPGLSIGKAIIISTYFGIIMYAGLHKSNPFTDPVRAGFVAVSQLPVVIMLATKNNILGMLISVGYEQLNFLHRFAARLFVVAVNVHAIGYIYDWTAAGTFNEKIKVPFIAWGFVGLLASDLLVFFTTSYWRERIYALFVGTHVVCVILLLGSIAAHEPSTIPYIGAAVAFYAFDRVARVLKTRYTVAHLRAIPELNTTRIEIPSLNAGWRAGQHVRLTVLSGGMGWLGCTETHPFTIASASKSYSGEGLVLMVKKAGDWTGSLFEMAKRADYGEANGLGREVKVLVEGPYGGPGSSIFASYTGALFVVGGSGISFGLSAVQDLMQRDAERKSRVKVVELIWSVQDPSHLIPLLPLFASLLAQSASGYTMLTISVYYTRAPTSPDALKALQTLPEGLTLAPGRPRVPKALEAVVDRSCALFTKGRERRRGDGALTGVIVGVCGPRSLAEEVSRAAGGVPAKRRQAVGGVEVHQEVFGW